MLHTKWGTPLVRQGILVDRTLDDDAPIERRMTLLLVEALTATREATESKSTGDADAFLDDVESGTSANLCDALHMLIKPFGNVEISLT